MADTNNHRVQKFNSSGGYITQWGSSGSGMGEFNQPQGITVDNSGNVFVADTGNNRIQKFNSSGGYITQWGTNGSGNGLFNNPTGMAFDSSGNVYVADSGNNRIQKFGNDGNYLSQWGGSGSSDGVFNQPQGITIDSLGNIYVVDTGNNRVQKFDSNVNLLNMWGTGGTGNGQFNAPKGIVADAARNVYVVDSGNACVQVFSVPALLTPSTMTTTSGAPLSISWVGAPGGSSTLDWIGLYRLGDPNPAYLWFQYTGGSVSGTLNLTAPTALGNYEFRYFINNGYTQMAVSKKVVVTGASPYSLTPSTTLTSPNAPISVAFTAPAGSASNDWVGLYALGAPDDNSFLWWSYTNGATSGTFNLNAPKSTGNYEFRYYKAGSYFRVATSVMVTVSGSNQYTLTPSTTSTPSGSVMQSSWTAPSGSSPTDWIGLYQIGSPDNSSFVWWAYTGGAPSGSFNVPMNVPPGIYEFRYYLNNGYTKAVTSVPIIVF